ncbi:hypothetical protein [Virgibacillus kimchii]
MENKEKSKQGREKSRLNNPGQTAKKVKSEKLRYKNADSIYNI